MNLKKSFLKFLVGAVFVSALFFISINLHAAEIKVEKVEAKPITFTPQITIPGSEIFKKGVPFTITKETMPTMARDLYKFLVGSAGMVAVIVMMAGGYLWIFAGGNTARVGQAKDYIGGAVVGLTLALGSYMILNMINPDLINMKDFEIPTVPKITIPEPPTVAGYKWPGLDCKWVAGGVPNEGGYIAVKLEKNQRAFCGNTPAAAQIETSKTVNNEGSGQASTVAADYTCFCKITSQCTAVSSGDCSVSNLEKYFGDTITAEMASRICMGESGGNPNAKSGIINGKLAKNGFGLCYRYTGDPNSTIAQFISSNYVRDMPYSIGLFQINLRSHSIGLNCTSAFEAYSWWDKVKFFFGFSSNCLITNIPLYDSCVIKASIPDFNTKYAKDLSKIGTDWKDWEVNYNKCYFPQSRPFK